MIRKLINEFANTFREWHYLVVGLAVGFASGLYVGVKLMKNTIRRMKYRYD